MTQLAEPTRPADTTAALEIATPSAPAVSIAVEDQERAPAAIAAPMSTAVEDQATVTAALAEVAQAAGAITEKAADAQAISAQTSASAPVEVEATKPTVIMLKQKEIEDYLRGLEELLLRIKNEVKYLREGDNKFEDPGSTIKDIESVLAAEVLNPEATIALTAALEFHRGKAKYSSIISDLKEAGKLVGGINVVKIDSETSGGATNAKVFLLGGELVIIDETGKKFPFTTKSQAYSLPSKSLSLIEKTSSVDKPSSDANTEKMQEKADKQLTVEEIAELSKTTQALDSASRGPLLTALQNRGDKFAKITDPTGKEIGLIVLYRD